MTTLAETVWRGRAERAEAALEEAYRQIRILAEQATDRLQTAGADVDPAERTYQPIIDRIKAMVGQDGEPRSR
jgi:hypothetical protein